MTADWNYAGRNAQPGKERPGPGAGGEAELAGAEGAGGRLNLDDAVAVQNGIESRSLG